MAPKEWENHLIDSYTHSFILYSQVFIKSLLYDRACARHWGYKDEKDVCVFMSIFSHICLEQFQLFQMVITIVCKCQAHITCQAPFLAFDIRVFIMSLWGRFYYYSHFIDEVRLSWNNLLEVSYWQVAQLEFNDLHSKAYLHFFLKSLWVI